MRTARAIAGEIRTQLKKGGSPQTVLPRHSGVVAFAQHETDDLVLKGLGWLLREAAKAKAILPFLMELRGSAPRLVLRCETLPPGPRQGSGQTKAG